MERRSAVLIGIVCVVALVLFYMLTSAKTVQDTISVPVTKTQMVNMTVPRSVVEEYPETEYFQVDSCANQTVNFTITAWNGTYTCAEYSERCLYYQPTCDNPAPDGTCANPQFMCAEYECLHRDADCFITVRNDDPGASATFSFSMEFYEGDIFVEQDAQQVTLGPGEDETLTWTYAMNNSNQPVDCNYVVKEIAEKESCVKTTQSRVVSRSRNITYYDEVETQEETRVFDERTRVRTVNRFFGYPQRFDWGY